MKRALTILGGIFAVILVLGGIFFARVAYVGSGLDKSSKAYVDESLPAIVSTWSSGEVERRAAPDLLKIIHDKPDEFRLLFQKLSTLGALQHYDGSKGDANIFYDAGKGRTISANYIAEATFDKGEARIAVRLVQISGEWKILFFNVNSPYFLQAH